MTVAARAEDPFAIVEVERGEAAQAERAVGPAQGIARLQASQAGVASGKDVAGVQTGLQPRVTVQSLDQPTKILTTPIDAFAASGGG